MHLTITEAVKKLGQSSNPHLVRALIKHHGIPFERIGNAIVVDEFGFEQLKTAHDAWVNRPRISKLRQSVSN